MRPETATTRARPLASLPFVPALPAAALLAFAAAFFPPAAVHAQQQDAEAAVEQAARRAFHGDDLTGKDGPMGKASMELARIHERAVAATSLETSAATSAAPEMVIVDAVARENAEGLMSDLQGLGLENGAVAGPIVSGRLPAAALEQAARLEKLRFLRRSPPVLLAGDALSQGVAAMNADDARANQNVDGSGVRVGVLSDSYNQDADEETTAPEDQASNDLPDDVIVLDDSDAGGTDEGRAMMQLTYDTAPGTVMAFHTATGGKANFANGICELAGSAGEDGICSGATGTPADASEVITDDIIYFNEPFFQDGVVAQAVDYVVDDDSVAYFSSAGNYADQSYESRRGFDDSGKTGPNGNPLHDFAPSSGVTDAYQQITVGEGERMLISFQWEEPYASACEGCPGASTDLDLFVYNADSSTVLASSQNDNDGSNAPQLDSQNPIEVIDYTNNSGSSTLNLAISQKSDSEDGSEDGLLKYIIGGGGVPVDGAGEHDTGFSTLFGHANADSAEAIGAAYYDDTPEFGTSPPVLEGFSAEGGTPILFNTDGSSKSSQEVRQKPELVAPDGTNNTFFGSDFDGDGSPNFFGTSAAAPHAAGVAALFREGRPNSSAFTIYSELERTATDMNNPYSGNRTATENGTDCSDQFDFGTGCGLVNAEEAALPVTLAGGGLRGALDERDDASAVVLTWTTLSETGNDHFRILQKHDEGFAQVGTEPTQAEGGASSRPLDYRHRVGGLAPGTHVFRLVQVDADGAERRIGETRVEVGFEGSYQLTAAHPNPFRTHAEARLTVRRSQHVTAALYDASGRRVRTLHDGPLPGGASERFALEAEALSSGVYVLRVSGETFSATRTLTLVR